MAEGNKLRLKLSKIKLPELKEVKPYRGSYYMAGDDNNYFNELIKLYEQSSIHNTFINNLVQKVYGSGLIGDDEQSQMVIDEMKLNDLYRKIILDYALFGGYSIEVRWGALHTKILEANYYDFSKIRSGFIDDETEKVELYYYSYNWQAYHKHIEVIQSYNTDEKTDIEQIYYYKGHHPGTDIYPRPYYVGGLYWIYTDISTSKYYANLVKNNFVGNMIIDVPNSMEPDKQVEFEKGIKESFTGDDNAGSIVVLYGDGGENQVQLLEFNKGSSDNQYQWLVQETMDQLVIAHNIPNPIIAGIRVPGTLGGAQEMTDAENIYNRNMIYPTRGIILDSINELNKHFQTPITYTVNDIELFKNIEEGETDGNN